MRRPRSRARSSLASPIRRRRPATMARTASPAELPHAWLIDLKRSRSRSTTATDPGSASRSMTRVRCSSNCSRVGNPVNGVGRPVRAEATGRHQVAATRGPARGRPPPVPLTSSFAGSSGKTRASTAIRWPVPLSKLEDREHAPLSMTRRRPARTHGPSRRNRRDRPRARSRPPAGPRPRPAAIRRPIQPAGSTR